MTKSAMVHGAAQSNRLEFSVIHNCTCPDRGYRPPYKLAQMYMIGQPLSGILGKILTDTSEVAAKQAILVPGPLSPPILESTAPNCSMLAICALHHRAH